MLKIENLKVRHEQQVVLEDINLEISDQEIIALVGPSGTGKSTLLNSITGLKKIEEGRITLKGKGVNLLSDIFKLVMRSKEKFLFSFLFIS